MNVIDLTSSSPAIHARGTRAATAGRIRPRQAVASRATATTAASRQPVLPRRQLRGRAVGASSISNSLGTTPTTTSSSNQDSPGLFLAETDSDDDEDEDGSGSGSGSNSDSDSEENSSLDEYLRNREGYLSLEDSESIDSDSDSDATDDDSDDFSEEVDGAPRPIASAGTRGHSTFINPPVPSRASAATQPSPNQSSRAVPPPPPQPQLQHQHQQKNLKRPRAEAEMPSASPAPKKAKAEPVEVVDMINIEDEDDFKKIMHEQMIKTQREEGNARRKIADFKCVICLDDPENLSATTCGHLFCNECIKTTLRFGKPSAKFGKCPVCRGKVVIKEIVPLELKLIKRIEGKGKGKA